MQVARSMRFALLALLICLIPLTSHAAVLISVGIAPPVLPVYVQPPCPQPGWMWTPGYWAYGADGYYWVPGTWVPAPYVGALWTPGYWGWGSGLYVWHPGYWGPHVGYYGGVNYGFGYMGIGFVGGMWRGGMFAYNTAVMHVGIGPGWGGNRVYVDRTIVERNTIINDRHVAYSGGPGGINHAPTAVETRYSNERHVAATSFQTQHRTAAMQDRASYFSNNHGRPANVAVARPMGANVHATAGGQAYGSGGGAGKTTVPEFHGNAQTQFHGNVQTPANTSRGRPQPESRPAPQNRGGEQHGGEPRGQQHSERGHDHQR